MSLLVILLLAKSKAYTDLGPWPVYVWGNQIYGLSHPTPSG